MLINRINLTSQVKQIKKIHKNISFRGENNTQVTDTFVKPKPALKKGQFLDRDGELYTSEYTQLFRSTKIVTR